MPHFVQPQPAEVVVADAPGQRFGGLPNNIEEMADGRYRHRVPLLPAASDFRDGLVRVVNLGGFGGEVLIDAVDDAGEKARPPCGCNWTGGGRLTSTAWAWSKAMPPKGWPARRGRARRLALSSTLDLQVLSYVRAQDGFIATMHDVAPIAADGSHRVSFFNPGSNTLHQSKLRLLNNSTEAVSATVTGIDDAGWASTEAILSVPAGAALAVTAAELEAGNRGISGRLGDSYGKWRLRFGGGRAVDGD